MFFHYVCLVSISRILYPALLFEFNFLNSKSKAGWQQCIWTIHYWRVQAILPVLLLVRWVKPKVGRDTILHAGRNFAVSPEHQLYGFWIISPDTQSCYHKVSARLHQEYLVPGRVSSFGVSARIPKVTLDGNYPLPSFHTDYVSSVFGLSSQHHFFAQTVCLCKKVVLGCCLIPNRSYYTILCQYWQLRVILNKHAKVASFNSLNCVY